MCHEGFVWTEIWTWTGFKLGAVSRVGGDPYGSDRSSVVRCTYVNKGILWRQSHTPQRSSPPHSRP